MATVAPPVVEALRPHFDGPWPPLVLAHPCSGTRALARALPGKVARELARETQRPLYIAAISARYLRGTLWFDNAPAIFHFVREPIRTVFSAAPLTAPHNPRFYGYYAHLGLRRELSPLNNALRTVVMLNYYADRYASARFRLEDQGFERRLGDTHRPAAVSWDELVELDGPWARQLALQSIDYGYEAPHYS